jgi:hypothetical protein
VNASSDSSGVAELGELEVSHPFCGLVVAASLHLDLGRDLAGGGTGLDSGPSDPALRARARCPLAAAAEGSCGIG